MIGGHRELPVIDAIRQRHAVSVVGRFEVTEAVERQPNHSGRLDVELPSLRKDSVGRAVAQDANSPAKRSVPKRLALLCFAFGDDSQAWLVNASQVRVI